MNGKIEANNDSSKADVAIYNTGDGKLSTGEDSFIKSAGSGASRVIVKNTATGGMNLNGSIENLSSGDTAINNGDDTHTNAGEMFVGGTIKVAGNLGIKNRSTGKMTVRGNIKNEYGDIKIRNVNGEGDDGIGMSVGGDVSTDHGNLALRNEKGSMHLPAKLSSKNGDLTIISKANSEGIYTTPESKFVVENGNLAIKHAGNGTLDDGKGINLTDYTVIEHKGNGEVAINNFKGDTYVGGEIKTNVNTAIINRDGSGNLTVNAKITAENDTQNKPELRIQNYAGTGNMTVNGDITHNGRLNILSNEGTLTLGGKIHNTGSDRTYAIAKGDSDGIVVKDTFNATSEDGMIYILNKNGQDGFEYKGTAKSTNGQVELYNMNGNMVVNGGSLEGAPTIILNKGGKLTVTNEAAVTGNNSYVRIVNKGDEQAEIGTNHKSNFREKLKETK